MKTEGWHTAEGLLKPWMPVVRRLGRPGREGLVSSLGAVLVAADFGLFGPSAHWLVSWSADDVTKKT